ncbi:MAG TPA: DUF6519 domain-containing protein [Thermoanaerobaculia bacterium]|jgi:hypothetical protein|nr:DUF6519 domain-containing protein [Thermoanaerobaculia bacterium]
MGSDLSRMRSNPLLDFAGVELKQGGVVLDADFNELVAVLDRRLRAAASDILGRSTVSQTTPDAFKVTAVGGSLQIGKGRMYVDGLLAENHGAVAKDPAKRTFDPLLAEPAFADPVDYAKQPYLPSPPPLPTAGRHLVYLDVWQREVTHLERPELIEAAVGVESSSRLQTVWQVRVLAEDATGAGCDTADADLAGWPALIAPSPGRLTTGTFDVPPADDPCELPPTGGYRGLENQTYRVEIQDPGQPGGAATFKWSRDNASIGSRVASMVSAGELELQTLGRDGVLRFNTGDWVEILDDVRELAQRGGELRRITVNEAARRITFTPALPADMVPAAFPDADFPRDRNLRVRRWDQKGKVLQAAAGGTVTTFQDLDASGSSGAIAVPVTGTVLLLENGVTVSFSSVAAAGFRAGDFWVFAARTADASVELLDAAPPRGIHHHYARLGMWDVGGDVTDCRTPWPPRGEGHDCSCTACVTPESHASGALTIQAAVDRIRETGGTVCLGVGHYQLREPVRLVGARAVRIRGQGAATLVVTPGGAFEIANGVAVAIEDLAILSLGRGTVVSVRTALGLALQRLIIAVVGIREGKEGGAAIALGGAVIGATLRDNAIFAPVAVRALDREAAAPAAGVAPPPAMLLSAALRVEDNLLWCERQAVDLSGRVLHLLATRIAGNEVLGCRQGAITALGLCAPGASLRVADNSLTVSGPGVTAGVDGLWIEGNKLVAVPAAVDDKTQDAAITLRTGLDPTGADQCQILANQISGFRGAGIAVRSPARALIVKLNVVERCGNGIVSDDEANAATVSIENNQVSDIGDANDERSAAVVGIGVHRAQAATVAGNTVRRVGQQAVRAPLRAGIAAISVGRFRATGNDVADVGPSGEFVGLGVGVLLRAPYAEAEVAHNHVDRDAEPSSQPSRVQWFALLVDSPSDDGRVSRVGVHAAVRLDEAHTLVFGARRPYLVAAAAAFDAAGAVVVRGASASVLGNVLAARGQAPAVEVAAPGDCLFSDNRCELRTNGNAPAVHIAAGAVIVNANRVRGGELASVELKVGNDRFTALGNITTADIRVAGVALPPTGLALNVRAH